MWNRLATILSNKKVMVRLGITYCFYLFLDLLVTFQSLYLIHLEFDAINQDILCNIK